MVRGQGPLPVALGSLGLRRASLHAPAAFISSSFLSESLISDILGFDPSPLSICLLLFSLVLFLLIGLTGPPPLTVLILSITCQVRSTWPLSRGSVTLLPGSDLRFKALCVSTSLPHSGDWLRAIPSPALGLHLQDWEFHLCLLYWLGVPMVEEGSQCPLCLAATDPFGDHFIACGGNGDRILRHNSVRDVLFSAARSAGPSLIPNLSSHPADIFPLCFTQTRPAAIDISIISPLQQLTLSRLPPLRAMLFPSVLIGSSLFIMPLVKLLGSPSSLQLLRL